MDNAQYKAMFKNILANTDWYHPISFSDLDAISIKFYELVDQARDDGIINNKICKFIKTPHSRISTFFFLNR